jgi:hypothetical protein
MKEYFTTLWYLRKLILFFSILNALIILSCNIEVLVINAFLCGFISVFILVNLIYFLDKYDLLEKISKYFW